MVPIAVAANMNYIYMEVPSYSSGIPRLYKVSKIDMGPELLPLKQTNVIQLPWRLGQKDPPVKRISAQLFHCKFKSRENLLAKQAGFFKEFAKSGVVIICQDFFLFLD